MVREAGAEGHGPPLSREVRVHRRIGRKHARATGGRGGGKVRPSSGERRGRTRRDEVRHGTSDLRGPLLSVDLDGAERSPHCRWRAQAIQGRNQNAHLWGARARILYTILNPMPKNTPSAPSPNTPSGPAAGPAGP